MSIAEQNVLTIEETEVQSDVEQVEELARLWRVICHDDPVTTMDFVVEVFTKVFRQPVPRAMELMLRVHQSGSAVVGLWPESVAKKKVNRARSMARVDGFPLTFSVEEDD